MRSAEETPGAGVGGEGEDMKGEGQGKESKAKEGGGLFEEVWKQRPKHLKRVCV